MNAIANESYVSLTTFKADGTARPVPVWIVDLGDGTVGFTTSSSSYKVKRLNNDPRVELEPCDRRGTVAPGATKVTGTAVASTADFDRVKSVVKGKYGFQYALVTTIGKVAKLLGRGSGTDTAVVITLDG